MNLHEIFTWRELVRVAAREMCRRVGRPARPGEIERTLTNHDYDIESPFEGISIDLDRTVLRVNLQLDEPEADDSDE
jgi:hypothetical protein